MCKDLVTDSCNFTSYVSSLPPAVRPHLEYQLDYDNKGVDKDLYEIAHLMLDWDLKLAAHLELTEIDINDIKKNYLLIEPELQR